MDNSSAPTCVWSVRELQIIEDISAHFNQCAEPIPDLPLVRAARRRDAEARAQLGIIDARSPKPDFAMLITRTEFRTRKRIR